MMKLKKIVTVSTYGPMRYGVGHDTTTKGPIKDESRITTLNGVSDIEELLVAAVKAWDIRRGDKLLISIEPFLKRK